LPGGVTVRGDTKYLRQAYSRLIENAVKFTPGGGQIQISGRIITREEALESEESLAKFSDSFFEGPFAERYLKICICDSGIGISSEDQLLIFDKFHEIGDISRHSTSKSEFGGKGVGLGLTLVKGIIEIHKGLIWVDSRGADQGSRFLTLLPMIESAEAQHVIG
jgi:signal transduction histidine kinase